MSTKQRDSMTIRYDRPRWV